MLAAFVVGFGVEPHAILQIQMMALLEPVLAEATGECEYRDPPGHRWAEPEAIAPGNRLGTADASRRGSGRLSSVLLGPIGLDMRACLPLNPIVEAAQPLTAETVPPFRKALHGLRDAWQESSTTRETDYLSWVRKPMPRAALAFASSIT
jgi:hypothetical protein